MELMYMVYCDMLYMVYCDMLLELLLCIVHVHCEYTMIHSMIRMMVPSMIQNTHRLLLCSVRSRLLPLTKALVQDVGMTLPQFRTLVVRYPRVGGWCTGGGCVHRGGGCVHGRGLGTWGVCLMGIQVHSTVEGYTCKEGFMGICCDSVMSTTTSMMSTIVMYM